MTKIPHRLELPVAVEEVTNELTIWAGEGELRQGAKKRTGVARILIRMEPSPDICYEFKTSNEPSLLECFAAMAEADLSDCERFRFDDAELRMIAAVFKRGAYVLPFTEGTVNWDRL